MTKYLTQQFDTWDAVSYRVYSGDEKQVGVLIAANPQHINTVLFSEGVVLVIPAPAELPAATTLPPWRR